MTKVKRKICWLVAPGSIEKRNGKLTSVLASNRYRVILPALALAERHQVSIFNFRPNGAELVNALTSYDTIIVGKVFEVSQLEPVLIAKSIGLTIIADVCDVYRFTEPEVRAIYLNLFNYADIITVNSNQMKVYLAQHTSKPISVVDDPCEGEFLKPVFQPKHPILNLLWYGYSRNIEPLVASVPDILSKNPDISINLTLVTKPSENMNMIIANMLQQHDKRLSIKMLEWSVETVANELKTTDIVIIPNKLVDDGIVKSANRLIEALSAGRFVVASPIPAYIEFAPWAYIGESIGDGIRFAIENIDSIPDRIKNAQQYISENYSQSAIADKWDKVFSTLPVRRASPSDK